MIDKYDLLSAIAPIAAPAAPATMLVNILYADLIRETVNQNFALFAAVSSGIGAEASGMIAAYVGIQAYRKKKYGLMMIAILAFIAYASFMALGISAARNPMTMISTIVISIIAYLAVAMLTDLRSIQRDAQAETDRQIAAMDAERKLTNALTRNAKASIGKQTGKQATQFQADEALIKLIKMYWTQNPGASYREVAQACKCAPSTAGKYKP